MKKTFTLVASIFALISLHSPIEAQVPDIYAQAPKDGERETVGYPQQ